MNMQAPRVSIGLPVYNGERYLASSLDSLLAQSYEDFEIIISDNASTDATAEICKAYAMRDTRIRYYRNATNIGGPRNLNYTIELARGEYFKVASHDDLCAPDLLLRCIEVLDREPTVVVCHPWSQLIDEQGQWTQHYKYNGKLDTASPKPYKRFLELNRTYHMCLQFHGLTRLSALRQTPLMGTYPSSDRVLIAHLALLGRIHEVPEYLFFFRFHDQPSMRLVPHLYAQWLDPLKQRKVQFPVWHELRELYRAVGQTPLRLVERVLCQMLLLVWPFWSLNSIRLTRDLLVAALLAAKRVVATPSYTSSTKA